MMNKSPARRSDHTKIPISDAMWSTCKILTCAGGWYDNGVLPSYEDPLHRLLFTLIYYSAPLVSESLGTLLSPLLLSFLSNDLQRPPSTNATLSSPPTRDSTSNTRPPLL
ncbi:hypothetical protein FRC02_001213 [Tulasnella sp. 418]|nr:hypothetical protein FRC02_001213 [Tulasnella sp. 418]